VWRLDKCERSAERAQASDAIARPCVKQLSGRDPDALVQKRKGGRYTRGVAENLEDGERTA
jgi:hypothetical protein